MKCVHHRARDVLVDEQGLPFIAAPPEEIEPSNGEMYMAQILSWCRDCGAIRVIDHTNTNRWVFPEENENNELGLRGNALRVLYFASKGEIPKVEAFVFAHLVTILIGDEYKDEVDRILEDSPLSSTVAVGLASRILIQAI